MLDNEMELINIIRTHDNPTLAIEIAIKTILEFLEQHESFEEQAPVVLRELA